MSNLCKHVGSALNSVSAFHAEPACCAKAKLHKYVGLKYFTEMDIKMVHKFFPAEMARAPTAFATVLELMEYPQGQLAHIEQSRNQSIDIDTATACLVEVVYIKEIGHTLLIKVAGKSECTCMFLEVMQATDTVPACWVEAAQAEDTA